MIPLGVDTSVYQPQEREQARRALGIRAERLPPGAFVVGSVGRNQPRKRLDLTILYFADWIRANKIDDAYLYLHVAPTGEAGIDCVQLASYCGITNRLIMCEPNVWHGASEARMALTYAAFDVLVNTAQGEGWSLPTLEAMACGIPAIVPAWAALGEWPSQGAHQVRCSGIAATTNHINVLGGIVDHDDFIAVLDHFYRNPEMRAGLSERALALAREERFQWRQIGTRLLEVVEHALSARVVPVGTAPVMVT